MSTQATPDGKEVINSTYHGTVVAGLTLGYAHLGKAGLGGAYPKQEFTPRDVGMTIVRVKDALATRDLIIKKVIIPADISK